MRERQDLAATPEPGDDALPAPAADPIPTARRAPGKKNTRDWCKGKVGRSHLTAIHRPVNTQVHHCRWEPYDWARLPDGGFQARAWVYWCGHVEICVACEKIIRQRPLWRVRAPSVRIKGCIAVEECPDYRPPPTEPLPVRYPRR